MSNVSRRGMLEAVGTTALAVSLPAVVRAQALVPVHVGASLDDGLTPVLYALKAGIFKKAGLDVTLTAAQNGAALAAAVVGGSVDIGKTALMPLLSAHAHGVNFKMIAGAVLYLKGAGTAQLCALKEGGIASLADVNGKTVAVASLQSLDQMVTEAMIDLHGGNSATVHFLELSPAAMLGGLESGRAAVASIGIPVLGAVLETGKVRALGDPFESIGNRYLKGGWFCTADFATRNTVTVRSFAVAMREAATYTNAHHDETVPILAAYSGLDQDALRKMHRDTNATEVDPRDIQPAIDAAYKYKFINAPFDAKELIV